MSTRYTVKQGDHISSIAHQFGFRDYRTIWDDAENADLKKARQNPNVLYPGDVIVIPDKLEKKESCETTRLHRFELPGPKLKLRIRLRNLDSKPMKNKPCTLEVEGASYKLTTDGEGLVQHEIPATAKKGRLLIGDLEFPLQIGHLDPVDELSGWRERLNNLGYIAGASDDLEDEQLMSALQEFQCDYGLKVDGVCGASTQAKLKETHGS
jgi:hypothetical protein